MIKFGLAKKLNMITYFKENEAVPATLIQMMKCTVKKLIKDNYTAVQLECYDDKKKRYLKEFRVPSEFINNFQIGQDIDINFFNIGDKVNITGISKGKGFQGVVKRWGFRDAPRTHGQTTKYRHPGSIGATTPQRVRKGLRMAGRMGAERVVVKNLEILDIDPENNLLVVKGSLPGHRKGLLEIRSNNLTRKGKLQIKK
jgi:large subunit ribosomal protein L3